MSWPVERHPFVSLLLLWFSLGSPHPGLPFLVLQTAVASARSCTPGLGPSLTAVGVPHVCSGLGHYRSAEQTQVSEDSIASGQPGSGQGLLPCYGLSCILAPVPGLCPPSTSTIGTSPAHLLLAQQRKCLFLLGHLAFMKNFKHKEIQMHLSLICEAQSAHTCLSAFSTKPMHCLCVLPLLPGP